MIPVIEVPISVKDVVMALSTEAMLPPADSEANTGTQDATAAPAPATAGTNFFLRFFVSA